MSFLAEASGSDFLAHLWLGRAYEEKGMYAEAVLEFDKVQKALPGWPVATAATGWVYGRWGKTSEARGILAELNAQSNHRYVSAYAIALVYAGLGDKDESLRFLNLGMKERTNWMVWTAVDPRWQPVRTDAGFQQLLQRARHWRANIAFCQLPLNAFRHVRFRFLKEQYRESTRW